MDTRSARLRRALERLGWTQRKLADELGLSGQSAVSAAALGRYEPSEQLVRHAELLVEAQPSPRGVLGTLAALERLVAEYGPDARVAEVVEDLRRRVPSY